MFFTKAIVPLCCLFLTQIPLVYAQQQIKGFYLSNIKGDGSRDWEVEGKEAHIFDKHVDIDDVKANYFTQDDTIVITSDKAQLDKTNMDVKLEQNVNLTNKEGAKLVTDSLHWKRNQNQIETDDWVVTTRDDMKIKAKGFCADSAFKTADFEENVQVTLPDEKSGQITTITCSGPLEIEYQQGTAVFNKDVVVTHPQGKLFSDKATLFFDTTLKKISKIVAEGNVKIVRDDNVTFAQKATYFGREQKIILEGRPRLIYFPEDKK